MPTYTITYSLTSIDRTLSILTKYGQQSQYPQVEFVNSQLKKLTEHLNMLLNSDNDIKAIIIQLLSDYPSVNMRNIHHFKKRLQPWLDIADDYIVITWKKTFPLMLDEAIRVISNYDLDILSNDDRLLEFNLLYDRVLGYLDDGKIVERQSVVCHNHLSILMKVIIRIRAILYRSANLSKYPNFDNQLFNEMLHHRLVSGSKYDKVKFVTIYELLLKEKLDIDGSLLCDRSRKIITQYKTDCLAYLIDLKEAMNPLFA